MLEDIQHAPPMRLRAAPSTSASSLHDRAPADVMEPGVGFIDPSLSD